MSRTKSAPGNVITIPAPADVVNGVPIIIGSQIAVPLATALTGVTCSFAVKELHELPAVSGAEFVAGEQAIFDVSAGLFDDHSATPATGDLTGACIAWETKTAAAGGTILVELNAGVGAVTA